MLKNEMLVDFTGVNENGDIYGEEVIINLNDLKISRKIMSLANRLIFVEVCKIWLNTQHLS